MAETQHPKQEKEAKAEQPKAQEAKKEKIRKGDFIEIDYIGALKSDGKIFDTTDKGVAKKEGFYNENHEYGPAIICVGEHNIVRGIDKQLEGKDTNTEYVLNISPEEGFGKKNAKLIQLVSTTKFLKQSINPMPGLQVNIDNNIGTIKSVSGGRTLVDFNHPLSSQELVYKIRVNRVVKEDKEKLRMILTLQMGLPKKDMEIEVKDSKGIIKTKQKLDLPKDIVDAISKKVNGLIPSIKEVRFE